MTIFKTKKWTKSVNQNQTAKHTECQGEGCVAGKCSKQEPNWNSFTAGAHMHQEVINNKISKRLKGGLNTHMR